jgi:hypothetical protein
MEHLGTASKVDDDGLRQDESEIPGELVRELISNAIAHRDYGVSDVVELRLEPEWLEIRSPGLLKQGLTWEKLLSQEVRSTPVDLQLMLFLRKLLVAEQVGRGFDVIRNYVQERPRSIAFDTPLDSATRVKVRRLREGPHVIVPLDGTSGPRPLQVDAESSGADLRPSGRIEQLENVGIRMKGVLQLARSVARSPQPILITGETGVGKEAIAQLVHSESGRLGRLVVVDCGALQEPLFATEFFGYQRGAFTGATSPHPGLLGQAQGGTLILDDVGEMPLNVQPRLLRVLESGEYFRVGGVAPIRADVRFVFTTHRDLRAEVEAGRFRDDLYYRLNAFQIDVPPLRERRDEIPGLIAHFAASVRQHKSGRPALNISPEAMALLVNHSWPGNVRELRNAVERFLLLAGDELITPDRLRGMIQIDEPAPPKAPESS